jgi:hypothetical protein
MHAFYARELYLRRELHGHDAERDDHAPGHGVVDDFVVHGVVEQKQVHVHEKTNEDQHARLCVFADDGIYGAREREGHCAFELVGDLGACERHAFVHGGCIYAFGCFIVIKKNGVLDSLFWRLCDFHLQQHFLGKCTHGVESGRRLFAVYLVFFFHELAKIVEVNGPIVQVLDVLAQKGDKFFVLRSFPPWNVNECRGPIQVVIIVYVLEFRDFVLQQIALHLHFACRETLVSILAGTRVSRKRMGKK